jgi:NAD kinase
LTKIASRMEGGDSIKLKFHKMHQVTDETILDFKKGSLGLYSH